MKAKIVSIAGDASYRKFYRIFLNKKSRIIIYAKKDKYQNLVAYIAVNNFLRKNKILAPKLYNHNLSKGFITIEDFGDLSLYEVLRKKKNKLKTYKEVVDLLIKLQKITPPKKIESTKNKPFLLKKYSFKLLHKESDLFFQWYLPLFFKKKKILKIKKNIKKILSRLYKKLNFKNSYFVHRDYHVQNLMMIRKNIGVIDSQDAVVGNPAYDLVSLVDDVRIRTSKSLKNQIYQYYVKKSALINKKNENFFFEDFNILSIQRSLKIIGIFSRLFSRDKKSKYLKLIPYTWKLLEMRMNYENFSDLKFFLDKNINKKIRNQTF